MTTFRNCLPLLAAFLFPVIVTGILTAQAASAAAPVSYVSVNEVNGLLDQVKQGSQNLQGDLARLRIDKWKINSKAKQDMQATVDSIQRNLQTALPEIMTQVSNSPEDLSASFKLYRNLILLYEYCSQVAGYASDLGSKDDAQSLENDRLALESVRRSFGERMQRLTTAKEEELGRLRTQIKTLQAAVPPPAPKKVIVDDTLLPKKPVAKKKPAKPATPPTTTNPPASPPPTK